MALMPIDNTNSVTTPHGAMAPCITKGFKQATTHQVARTNPIHVWLWREISTHALAVSPAPTITRLVTVRKVHAAAIQANTDHHGIEAALDRNNTISPAHIPNSPNA